MTRPVTPLGRDETEAAVEVLGRAFSEEGHFRALFPRGHPAALRAVMAMSVTEGRRSGLVEVTRDEHGAVDAVAVWHPPGSWPLTARDQLAALPHLARVGRHAGPAGLARLMRFGLTLSRLHPTTPHWHLSTLGAVSSGAGSGGSLLAHRLADADTRGEPAYLETQEESSAAFYRRFGFTVRGDPVAFDGFTSWQMLRPGRA